MAGHSHMLLHELFEEQARRTPANLALSCADRSITFAELATASDRVAGALRALGIGGGAFIGLHVDRSIDYIIALLGILKADSAVVPLPPSYPEARVREILSFAALDAVIDVRETPVDPGLSPRVLHLSDLAAGPGDAGGRQPGDPDQPAFVLCSSGSTGTPKMIVRSHRSFMHRLGWTWQNHPYTAGEVCCQKSFVTTTHAIYELFEPLLRGVPVVIISDQEVRDLEQFWRTIQGRRISRLLIVPSLLQASFDLPGFVAPPINVLVLMGEYVHPKLAGRALEIFREPMRIFSIYGSTEASSTLVCDLRESFRSGEELPLGKPISPDVRAFVLGDDLTEVRPGDTGMLHIAGSALFREYYKDPALTASVLRNAPDGRGLVYDTHDQVRRMPDGQLRFLGRIDHTVKIRGFRVDLEDVERTLLQHPDIRQAAVVVNDDGSGNASLLGFYAPETAGRGSVYQLLRKSLPAYMVPSTIVGLPVFPLTPSGKIDRRALLAAHIDRAPTPSAADASPTERRVLDVWRGLLKHSDIGLDSSFFEVGGTSLTVFSALRRLRDALSFDRTRLTDQAIYQFPTVRALAQHIDDLTSGTATATPAANSILVTLKRAEDRTLAPFFLVAPPGGTVGAYEKLARALEIKREVIGIRDPFVWGGRDPAMAFQTWVSLYVDAIRERQPNGPYYVAAYSSAGSFGYEIFRRLRLAGEDVRVAVLIDPLGIDSRVKERFGYWAFRARYMRVAFGRIVVLGGWLRLAALTLVRGFGRWQGENDDVVTPAEYEQMASAARRSRHHVRSFGALMEFNTGLPFGLADSDFAGVTPDRYLGVLLARVKEIAPDVDPGTVENMVIQYYLQTRAQHRYRLQRYDGRMVIYEPAVPQNGLLYAQFKPYVKDLRVVSLRVGKQPERTRRVSEVFSEFIRPHYLSMRDDEFVRQLARELEPLLA